MHDLWVSKRLLKRPPTAEDVPNMVSDVNLLMSQATALDSESKAAWEAWDSAADAVDQAELALLEADADPHSDRNRKLELHLKLQEALDDESKKDDRYQQIQEQLEEHCTKRRELILYLGAPKLTMRERVELQYPLLKEPSDPGRPLSNVQSAAPQTYTAILRWRLRSGARRLINSLNNTQHIYLKPLCRVQHDDSFEDQQDIRGRVVTMMDTVNAALKQLGSAVKCSGGGCCRSMSFADLIMRLHSSHSSLTDLSGQVLGTVLVKEDLSLKQGESLEEALNDPQRSGPIKAAIQEAFGMAVVDEAPVFVLTSYNATLFFKRSCDVTDKRLWASEPVWINQRDPSAAAMWALVLQQAEELRSWKAVLPRDKVPIKDEKREEAGSLHSLKVLSDFGRLAIQGAAASVSAGSRSSLRGASLVDNLASSRPSPSRMPPIDSLASCRLSLSSLSSVDSPAVYPQQRPAQEQQTDVASTPVSPTQESTPCPRLSLHACTPQSNASQIDSRASAPPPAAIDLLEPTARDKMGFEAEPTVLLSMLGLTGELLEGFEHGKTLKGTWEGKPTAVKVFNLRKRGAPAQYEMEKRAYSSLSDLHGKTVPRFLCSGLQAHTAAPVIVTSYEGKALADDEPMPGHLRK